MRTLVFLFVLVSFQISTNAQTDTLKIKKSDFVIGQSLEFQSEVLKEKRILNVYLPQSYHKDSAKKYPVIYLLDGSADEDFIHVSGLVQFASFPWINYMPESIVVGIANVDRRRDFTFPSTNGEDIAKNPTSGGSAAFKKFLEHEIIPMIDRTYHTDTVKTLLGQSLGGFFAADVLINKPDLFDNYIIVSPSMWWSNDSLLRVTPRSPKELKNVYLAVGRDEPQFMIRGFEELAAKLILTPSMKVSFDLIANHDHADVLHLAVYRAIRKLSAKRP